MLETRFDGQVQIRRSITEYQKDAFGNIDASWLQINTPETASYIADELEFIGDGWIQRRLVLVGDDDRLLPGTERIAIRPRTAKDELVEHYATLVLRAICTDVAGFERRLLVGRSPDVADPLLLVAFRMEFYAQFDPFGLEAA